MIYFCWDQRVSSIFSKPPAFHWHLPPQADWFFFFFFFFFCERGRQSNQHTRKWAKAPKWHHLHMMYGDKIYSRKMLRHVKGLSTTISIAVHRKQTKTREMLLNIFLLYDSQNTNLLQNLLSQVFVEWSVFPIWS